MSVKSTLSMNINTMEDRRRNSMMKIKQITSEKNYVFKRRKFQFSLFMHCKNGNMTVIGEFFCVTCLKKTSEEMMFFGNRKNEVNIAVRCKRSY